MPIIIPSSTSQSVAVEVLGISTLSLGPIIAEVAFENKIGSSGASAPVSAAWSEKLSPIHKNLPTLFRKSEF